MGKSKKAVAAGHICLDITPVFLNKPESEIGNILAPGKLINVGAADIHTGGSVANTGLGMKVLGADVALMGKVGNDEFGKMVLSILEEYKAEKGMIVSEDSSTSYSVVVAPQGIDRIFLHHPGANDTFQMSDINMEELADVALFHFGYPPLMKKMYEEEGSQLVELFKTIKEMGIATSLDMAAIDENAPVGKANWKGILQKLLPYVDFFVPSVEELCYMLDRERYKEWMNRAQNQDVTMLLDVEKDIKPLADELLAMGAKVVLIKCGAPGMYYRTASAEKLSQIGERMELDANAWADKVGFEKSYTPEKVLSGTGAGDTSIAAFLTAMLQGYTFEKCLQLSSATGASCVESYDALSGLRSFDEIEKKIEAGWEKQNF